MDGIIAKVNRLPFGKLIWILPIAWALHEIEEWNIISWYQRHFVNPPEITPLSLFTLLAFSTLMGFVWTFIASLFRNSKVTAWVLLLFFILGAFTNAVQHISWTVMFSAYSPGVISSAFLIIPSVIYVTWRVLGERLLRKWHMVILYLLTVPRIIETIKYGNNQKSWSPQRYRLEIWDNERWSWPVGRKSGAAELPAPGDSVVFFYAPSGGIDPGFYGWAVVLEWLNEENSLRFRPVAPSNHLKMCPWWNKQAQKLAESIRGPVKQGTLWRVPDDLVPELRSGITSWVGGNVENK